jgi:hypothetical protein
LDLPGRGRCRHASRGRSGTIGLVGTSGLFTEALSQGEAIAEVGRQAETLTSGHTQGGVKGVAGFVRASLALDVRQLVPDRVEHGTEVARVFGPIDADFEDRAEGLAVETSDSGPHR